jgi:hypothetical protein
MSIRGSFWTETVRLQLSYWIYDNRDDCELAQVNLSMNTIHDEHHSWLSVYEMFIFYLFSYQEVTNVWWTASVI